MRHKMTRHNHFHFAGKMTGGFFVITLFLLFAPAAFGQCIASADDPCISVHQSTVNKAAQAVDELKAAREVIAKFAIERSASTAEREAALVLIKSFDQLLATKDKIILEYERINTLYKQVVDFYAQLVEKMEKQMNKPRSSFQKFIRALKEIALVIGGIAIGRAGI